MTGGDAFLVGCRPGLENCPKEIGPDHDFGNAPILRTRALIDSGAFGAVRMIHALNYTDFLCRPRRPEELDTAQGGGATG